MIVGADAVAQDCNDPSLRRHRRQVVAKTGFVARQQAMPLQIVGPVLQRAAQLVHQRRKGGVDRAGGWCARGRRRLGCRLRRAGAVYLFRHGKPFCDGQVRVSRRAQAVIGPDPAQHHRCHQTGHDKGGQARGRFTIRPGAGAQGAVRLQHPARHFGAQPLGIGGGDHAAGQVPVHLAQLIAVDPQVKGRRRRLIRAPAQQRQQQKCCHCKTDPRCRNPECHRPSFDSSPCNRWRSKAKGAISRRAVVACRSAVSHFSRLCRL